MHITQLIFLQEVAVTHSMSQAAENLYVTPQYISKAIKSLEEELGLKIFRRSKTGVYLTVHGEKIYEKVVHILNELDDINQTSKNIKNTNNTPSGIYNLYLPYDFKKIIFDVLADYLLQYKDLHLNIFELDSINIINHLADNSINPDLFIIADEKGELSTLDRVPSEYLVYNICYDTMCIITSSSHPFAKNKKAFANGVNAKYLCNEAFGFCMENISTYNSIINLLARHNIHINNRIITNSFEDIINFVRNGTCITVNGNLIAEKLKDDSLCIIPLAEKINVIYRLFIHKGRYNDPFVEKLLLYLQKNYPNSFCRIN